MSRFYPSFKPFLDDRSAQAVANCVDQGEISGNFGKELRALEVLYSELHNGYHAVTCSSGTSALHLACLALGVDEKSTVVIPATTNMATFFAPMYNGANIICCDVNEDDGLIDFSALEAICQSIKVDVVMPVHLYGHVVSAKNLGRLSKQYEFKVIEDCAEAHFAVNDDGNYVGCSFDAGCFSFYANKIIAAGEGGIVLFKEKDSETIAKNYKNLSFSDHGEISKFYHKKIGFNYRLTNLSASLINVSLSDRAKILEARDNIRHWYNEELENCELVASLNNKLSTYSVNWVYCVKFRKDVIDLFKEKKYFLDALSSSGVEARDFFYPADHQPFFKEYQQRKNCGSMTTHPAQTVNSLRFYEGSIYLPVFLDMTREDIKYISNALKSTVYGK